LLNEGLSKLSHKQTGEILLIWAKDFYFKGSRNTNFSQHKSFESVNDKVSKYAQKMFFWTNREH